LVVRMKFLCMVAHLLHTFKAHTAFPAFVQALLVRHLLVLHQFLYFAEFFTASRCSGCPSTSCTGCPQCASQALGGKRTPRACHCRGRKSSSFCCSFRLFSGSIPCRP